MPPKAKKIIEEDSDDDIPVIKNKKIVHKKDATKKEVDKKKKSPKKEESDDDEIPVIKKKTPKKIQKEESDDDEEIPVVTKKSPKKKVPKKEEGKSKKMKASSEKDISEDQEVRKLFLQENNIPRAFDMRSPYFEDVINLYQILPTRWTPENDGENENASTLWDDFKNYMRRFKSFSDYEDYRHNLTMTIISAIKSSISYKEFLKDNLDQFPVEGKIYEVDINQAKFSRQFFSTPEKKLQMVLMDVKKGNFQSIQLYDSYIQKKKKLKKNDLMLKGAASYDDFLRLYTDDEFIIRSRTFRQILFMHQQLFGHKDIKHKIPHLEKYIKQEEFKKIKNPPTIISNLKDDEIILEKPAKMDVFDVIDFTKIRVEIFINEEIIIEGLAPAKPGSNAHIPNVRKIKEYVPASFPHSKDIKTHLQYQIRGSDGHLYPQLYKQIIYPLYDMEIPKVPHNSDLKVIFNTMYATLEPIKVISKHS
jgi:hypothetical protein